jgi:hypothetical protein
MSTTATSRDYVFVNEAVRYRRIAPLRLVSHSTEMMSRQSMVEGPSHTPGIGLTCK